MKIRNGFVSNSSSSSFCAYGTQQSVEGIKTILQERYPDFDKHIGEKTCNEDILSFLDDKFEYDADISIMFGNYSYFYIGRKFNSIRDDETGGQFKKTTEDKLAKVLGFVGIYDIEARIEY